MEVNQIYELANSIASQAIGKSAITVTDTASLVALGEQVLSSRDNVENFTNQLILRIGRTIISYRDYSNNLAPIMMDSMQWGAIVQKLDGEMPDIIEDEAWNLEDGKSVDMYIVSKPKLYQNFFCKRTTYSAMLTIWKKNLKDAFLSEQAMAAFVNSLYGRVRNKLELVSENLAKLTIDNFIALIYSNNVATQKVHLLTEYNAVAGTAITNPMQALYDESVLRFSVGRMLLTSKALQTMSTLYNGGGRERFTPKNKQIFIMNNMFDVNMATQVQYAAYNETKVSINSSMTLPYWQSPDNPLQINLQVKTGGTEDSAVENVVVDNVLGVIFDRDALGTFRKETEVETTPLNARGLYTNTFWHEDQMYFNDINENGVIFLLD